MLINSIAELKEYLPASVSLEWADIAPKVRMVERDTIRRIFSANIIDRVQQLGGTDQEAGLLDLLREATAHLALLHYIGFGQTQIDSAGIRIASNSDMKTAFEWQINDLRRECSLQGWNAIESALELMESLPAESDLLALWQATDSYALAQQSLIPTLREFQKYVHLGNSRVLFHKLLPTLQEQQQSRFALPLGASMWARILAYRSETDPDRLTRITQVRNMAARALAYATMGEGFANTLLVLTDNGPMVIDGLQSRTSNAKKTAPEAFVQAIADQYAAKASGAITALIAHLQANVTYFPEFKDSDNYIDDPLQFDHIPRNDPDWGIVFF